MQTENQSSKPEPEPEQETGEGCSGATCSAWVPITERFPKVGRRVLVCFEYGDSRRHITIASWQPAKSINAAYWEDVPEEWEDEDADTITNPTDLWLENPLEVAQCGFVENVTHWMPIPSLPNVKEHATLSAGASVDHGVDVETTGPCWIGWLVGRASVDHGVDVATLSAGASVDHGVDVETTGPCWIGWLVGRASVDHGVDVETTGEHENGEADRGCCVSTCCASSFVGCGWHEGQPPENETPKECPSCGAEVAVVKCESCHLQFVDWVAEGGGGTADDPSCRACRSA